jgi:hypothetical protein
MAVVNRNSTAISNETATPSIANSPPLSVGVLRSITGSVASAADDSATSIGRFLRLPSNACVSAVLLSCADATTAGNVDIGIYQTSENGGAVVDADFFASAFALTNGPYSNSDLTFESGEYTYAEADTPLWQALGLTADPQRDYDVAYTITTTFNGGPSRIRLVVNYTV